MRNRRTDLAMEARQLWQESAGETTKLEGVEAGEGLRDGFPVTTVRILNEAGEKALGKAMGEYVTLELQGLATRAEGVFARAVEAVSGELRELLPKLEPEQSVLVVGLGNRAITPDAIGPEVHRRVLVTRHLVQGMPEQFSTFRPVASLETGVLGTTGVESGELVHSVCRAIRPACVIAVDALASRSVERLCTTVQFSDTGIAPGSGVGNHRRALDRGSLGVPVIAIGVPTVVEAATLAADLMGLDQPPEVGAGQLLVTPKDIDTQVEDLSKVIAWGITMALQPGMTMEELELLLG